MWTWRKKNTNVYLEKEWMYTWRKNGCVPGERTDVYLPGERKHVYLEKEWMCTYLVKESMCTYLVKESMCTWRKNGCVPAEERVCSCRKNGCIPGERTDVYPEKERMCTWRKIHLATSSSRCPFFSIRSKRDIPWTNSTTIWKYSKLSNTSATLIRINYKKFVFN